MTTRRRPRSSVLSILLILSLAAIALVLLSGQGIPTEGSKPPVAPSHGLAAVVDPLRARFEIWGKQFTQGFAQLKFGGDMEARSGEDALDKVVTWAETAWGQVREAAKSLWIDLQAQFRRMSGDAGDQELGLAMQAAGDTTRGPDKRSDP